MKTTEELEYDKNVEYKQYREYEEYENSAVYDEFYIDQKQVERKSKHSKADYPEPEQVTPQVITEEKTGNDYIAKFVTTQCLIFV